MATKIDDLVANINNVISFIKEQNNMDENTDTSETLGGDITLQTLESRIRSTIFKNIETEFGPRRIGDLGLTFQKDGTLKLDTDKFKSKLDQNLKEVTQIINGRYLGIVEGKVKGLFETKVTQPGASIVLKAMSSDDQPVLITRPEFMRRMKEMQATGGGGMMGMGNFPDMYNLVVNTNHELVSEILTTKTEKKQKRLISQAFDLAKLSQNLLHGEELTNFIKRSYELIK